MLKLFPPHFKRYAKNMKLFVTPEFPELPAENFAVSFHNPENDFCKIGGNHFHLLVYSEKPETNGISITCTYACFKLLILSDLNSRYSGSVFEELAKAVSYNDKHSTIENRPSVLRKRLPKDVAFNKRSIANQTDYVSTEMLDRYRRVINGPYGGEFSQIIDVLLSGYGSVENQNHSMLVKFSLECAPGQCDCFECY